MPENNRLYGSYKSQGLVLIGVHIDPNVAKRDAIIQQKKVVYPVCNDKDSDGDNGTRAAYHVDGTPTIFVIDRKGVVTDIDPSDLEASIKKDLAGS